MRTTTLAFACLLLWWLPTCLSAQNPNLLLSYQKSDSLFVCGTDTFSVTITNNGAPLAGGAALNISLPNGILYVTGSVFGANQQNISNLQSPVFGLPAVGGNSSVVVKILLTATCSAAAVLDAGGLFMANISVTAPNANASVNTSSIPVETGLILITSVTDAQMQGELGDTLYRKICVKNTRLGKIGGLHFEDKHAPGFEISVANASPLQNTADFYKADFNSGIFAGVGNGDQWLDFGESVCFTERIIITDCGIPEFQNSSLLRVGWGCGADLCRYDSALVNLMIKRSTKVPNLKFTQIWNPPTDNCANKGAIMGVKIVNIGRGNGENITVKFKMAIPLENMAINPGSFRVVGSNGSITPLVPNLSTPFMLPQCSVQGASDVLVTVPLLAAVDSMTLLFEVLNCVESCNQELPALDVEYFYRKPCPINGFVSGSLKIKPDKAYLLDSYLRMNVGSCLQTGQSYPITFGVKSKRLTEANGFFNIDFEVPLGITLDPLCPMLLAGMAPIASSNTPTTSGGSLVHLTFGLPLPFDTSIMNFCVHFECDSNIVCEVPPNQYLGENVIYSASCFGCFVSLKERAYWSPTALTPYKCAIGDCNDIYLVLDAHCGSGGGLGTSSGTGILDSINIPPPNYRWKMDVARINFGYRDQDNNRIADDGSKALPAEIRRDRFLPGDTMRVSYCGVLNDSGIIMVLPRFIWHEMLQSDVGVAFDNDPYDSELARLNFTNSQNLRFLKDSLRIHYKNGNSVAFAVNDLDNITDKNSYTVLSINNYPSTVLDEIVTQRHQFTDSLEVLFAKGLVPQPFLGAGDSIFFYTDFKMDMNFTSKATGLENPPLVGFRTAVEHLANQFAWNLYPFKRLQYSGFIVKNSPNTFNIKPCENSVEPKKFRHATHIARENLFPFEVRPLANIDHYGQTVPNGLVVSSAKLNYLALQDSTPLLSNIPLPFSQSPGVLQVSFDPVFAQPIDEGFELGASVTFEPNCTLKVPESSTQWIDTRYLACLQGALPIYHDTLVNAIGFFAGSPRLLCTTSDSVVNAPTRSFSMIFNLENPVVSPVQSPWISIQSPSGLASDFQVFNMPQNQSITPQNGIYNLAAINGDTLAKYRISGKNISCETDSILLIFGWDCAPITAINQSSCFRDTYLIRLNLQKPELELNVLQEPANITLCDTSEYFEFEIYNAKTGYAYDLYGSVKLPDGLRIVPGTSQLFYPTLGSWATIIDPELLAGNLFRWDVSANQLAIGANGLPGVNLAPLNSVKIRFRTIADCGFVANSQNIYGTYGKEPCGRSSNILNKPGERLNILGLTPTYGVLVNLEAIGSQTVICGGTQGFAAQVSLLGTPSLGDSAVVILPQGAVFVAGSYVPGLNAPVGPPTITATGFRLPLPILVGGGNLQFTFKIAYGPGSACVDQIISLQTRVRTEAFCQSLGSPCEVYLSTGEYHVAVTVQHPELSITGVQTTFAAGQLNMSVDVNNIGSFDAPGAVVQIWVDVDGSQSLSPGDELVQTLSNSQVFGVGNHLLVTGIVNISPAQLCGLLVVLPGVENCACTDIIFPLNKVVIEHNTQTSCTAEPVAIGVDMLAGYQYQWQSDPGITCITCATTFFTPNPNTPPGQQTFLTLVESNGGCEVEHHFTLAFGALATISINNAIICAGQPVTLAAQPPNATYFWQGAGIQTPILQTQTIYPAVSSNYSLMITLANGCTATTTAFVSVLPSDSISLPLIQACVGTTVTVFGVPTLVENKIFKQALKKLNGCDSTILQPVMVLPKPMTTETRTFCVGDTIFIFEGIAVTGSTQVCRDFSAANGCDSTHCISTVAVPPPTLPFQDTVFAQVGQTIQLGGLLGYANYVWVPAAHPVCLDCPTITIVVDSTGYFEYLLTVTDPNGCTGSVIWRVIAAPPCDPQKALIPNAFTPNNDGVNDVFRPISSEGGELFGKITIYDRWGEKVYENRDKMYWDGTIKGAAASSDVYVYIIEVECANGKMEPRIGEVTLLR